MWRGLGGGGGGEKERVGSCSRVKGLPWRQHSGDGNGQTCVGEEKHGGMESVKKKKHKFGSNSFARYVPVVVA